MKKTVKTILICLLIGVLILPSFGCAQNIEIFDLYELHQTDEITRLDLFNVAYHNGDLNGNNKKLQKVEYPDFKPKEIGKISLFTKQKIKKALVKTHKNKYPYIKPRDFKVEFYGEYNGYYVIKCVTDYEINRLSQFQWLAPFYDLFRKKGEDIDYGITLGTKYIFDGELRKDWSWIAVKVK